VRRRYFQALGAILFLSFLFSAAVAGSAQTPLPPANFSLFLPLAQNSSCAAVELLIDGGFEAGLPNPAWQTSSNVFSDILDDTPLPQPHSGSWKAWMGGDNLMQESLWQTMTVPSGVQGIQVSYWWRVDTFETTHPFDTMAVQIRDAAGSPLQTLETLNDGDASVNWRQSSFTVSGYGGQTIQLAFVANTDGTSPTSFFLDDVSALRTCPGGLAGDVTGDCQVTVLDIQDTASHWRETTASVCFAAPYDQNLDGRIDVSDVQQVAGRWQ